MSVFSAPIHTLICRCSSTVVIRARRDRHPHRGRQHPDHILITRRDTPWSGQFEAGWFILCHMDFGALCFHAREPRPGRCRSLAGQSGFEPRGRALTWGIDTSTFLDLAVRRAAPRKGFQGEMPDQYTCQYGVVAAHLPSKQATGVRSSLLARPSPTRRLQCDVPYGEARSMRITTCY